MNNLSPLFKISLNNAGPGQTENIFLLLDIFQNTAHETDFIQFNNYLLTACVSENKKGPINSKVKKKSIIFSLTKFKNLHWREGQLSMRL